MNTRDTGAAVEIARDLLAIPAPADPRFPVTIG